MVERNHLLIMNKKILVLLPLFALALTSCGAETYTEVTDSTEKTADVKKANDAYAAEDNKSFTGVKVSFNRQYTVNSTNYNLTGYNTVAYKDNVYGAETSIKKDDKNYVKTGIGYDSSSKSYFAYYSGKAVSDSKEISVNFSVAAPASAVPELSSDTKGQISNALATASGAVSPSSFVSTTDFKLYVGSAGSYKLVITTTTDNGTYNVNAIYSKDGLMTTEYTEAATTTSDSASSSSATTSTYSFKLDFDYGAGLPGFKLSDYPTASTLDAATGALTFVAIMLAVTGEASEA